MNLVIFGRMILLSYMKRFFLFLSVLSLVICCGENNNNTYRPEEKPDEDKTEEQASWPERGLNATYINNGTLQIGIDLTRGGGICHFSEVGTKRNLLNHCDEGRFIQQSYYGDADGSSWNGTPWNWNPVQGGSWKGDKSEILSSNIEADRLTVVTRPRHWASGELLDNCSMTEVITLEGDCAHIVFTFSYTGTSSYKARHQEMPAVFCDAALGTLVYYDGSKPWTSDPSLKKVVPNNISDTNPSTGKTYGNQYVTRKEEWSAYVDSNDWGLGVYTPGTTQITYYTFGHGATGAAASPCSYFSPIRTLAITPNLILKYDIWVTIGTIAEIRSRFETLHRAS